MSEQPENVACEHGQWTKIGGEPRECWVCEMEADNESLRTRLAEAEKDRDMWKEEFKIGEEFIEDYVKELVAMEKKLTDVEKREAGIVIAARALAFHDHAADQREGLEPCMELQDVDELLREYDEGRKECSVKIPAQKPYTKEMFDRSQANPHRDTEECSETKDHKEVAPVVFNTATRCGKCGTKDRPLDLDLLCSECR